MYQNGMNTYQQSKFLTASPADLVLMCYEGAIGNLKLARDAYAEKDFSAKAKALQKALDMIYELNASLDMKQGGSIAANLRSIYLYLIRSLTEADIKNDLKGFDRAIAMIEELADAWKAIAKPAQHVPADKPLSAGMRFYTPPAAVKPGKNTAAAVA
jgi:flagellar secretion chaperone FliS